MVKYDDVKHLDEDGVDRSNLDLLAAVCAEVYERDYPSESKKRKSPSSCFDFLESSETAIPKKKRSSRKPRTQKDYTNSPPSSSSDSLGTKITRIERLLEEPIISEVADDNINCCSGLKLKFNLNASSSAPNNNQENESAKSGLKMNQERAKRRRQVAENDQGPALPGIPEHLKEEIHKLGGGRHVSECILVIQKRLYKSDVDSRQNRLLLPQRLMNEFLNDDEYDLVMKQKVPMELQIIEPRDHRSTADTVVLCKWDKVIDVRGSFGQSGMMMVS